MKPYYCVIAFILNGDVQTYEHFSLAENEEAARMDFHAVLIRRFGMEWNELLSKRSIIIRDMTRLVELERGRHQRASNANQNRDDSSGVTSAGGQNGSSLATSTVG